MPIETVAEALRIARAAEVTTILNPAPAVPLPDELLRLADLCVPNESEIELLTGGQTATTVQDAAAAAWELLKRGPRTVIVTLGERGADRRRRLGRPCAGAAGEAVDSSGAGDAFIGALGVFLAEGLALPRGGEAGERGGGAVGHTVGDASLVPDAGRGRAVAD